MPKYTRKDERHTQSKAACLLATSPPLNWYRPMVMVFFYLIWRLGPKRLEIVNPRRWRDTKTTKRQADKAAMTKTWPRSA